MEYRTIAETKAVATVVPVETPLKPMTQRQKLERWAEVVEKHRFSKVRMLHGIEYADDVKRRTMRADHSLFSIAYEDPVLRAQGLKGDTVGDAMDFFGINPKDLHMAACDCHYGSLVSSRVAAEMVSNMARRLSMTRSRARPSESAAGVLLVVGFTIAMAAVAASGLYFIH